MKKVLWTLLAVLCLALLMISAAAADSLPALQVELTSATKLGQDKNLTL